MECIQIDGTELPLLEPLRGEEPQRRIFRVLNMLFKHKFFIAKIFIIVSLPIMIVLLSMPTEYIAKAKILIKPTRPFLNLSDRPDAFYPTPDIMNTEIQIIKSKDLRQRLAKEVPFPGNGI